MSTAIQAKAHFGALRGLLYIRIQELMAPGAMIRGGLFFGLGFALIMLMKLDADGAAQRFHDFISGFYFLKFIAIFCLTKGGEVLRSELKDGTIEYLWVRPASKIELYFGFILSGYLGILAIIGPALLGMSLAAILLGAIGASGLLVLWLTVLAAVSSFTAISGAISSFSSKFVVLGIFYYSFVEFGLASIPNGVQRLAVSFHSKTLLSGLSQGGEALNFESFAWILATGALGLVVGAAIFSQSRYVVGGEKEA